MVKSASFMNACESQSRFPFSKFGQEIGGVMGGSWALWESLVGVRIRPRDTGIASKIKTNERTEIFLFKSIKSILGYCYGGVNRTKKLVVGEEFSNA